MDKSTITLVRGSYTLIAKATQGPEVTLLKGEIRVAGNEQGEPIPISFRIPTGMRLTNESFVYHSSTLHKGFALIGGPRGKKMYLPNTKKITALSL
jgi:hypothetical protein